MVRAKKFLHSRLFLLIVSPKRSRHSGRKLWGLHLLIVGVFPRRSVAQDGISHIKFGKRLFDVIGYVWMIWSHGKSANKVV
jgi:hypothetical protein